MTEAPPLRRRALVWLLLAGLVLSLTACAREPRVRFVDEQRVYTLAQVGENAATLRDEAAAATAVEEAAQTRQRALTQLRRQGTGANEAADLLTAEFPAVTASVPFYVEAATVDGKPCWVVMEAFGAKTGKLPYRRLWVFERTTKEIVDARMFR